MPTLMQALDLVGGGVISLVGAGGKTSLMFRLARELSLAGETVLTTTTTKIFVPSRAQSEIVMVTSSIEQLLDETKQLPERTKHVTASAAHATDGRKLIGFRPEDIDLILQAGNFRWIIVEADGAAGKLLKAPAEHEPVVPQSSQWVIGLVGLRVVGKPLNDQWVFRANRFSELTNQPIGSPISEEAVVSILGHPHGIFKASPSAAHRIVFLNQAEQPQFFNAGQRIRRLLLEELTGGVSRVVIAQTRHQPAVIAYTDLAKG